MPCKKLLLRLTDKAGPFHSLNISHHDCEGLRRAVFSGSEKRHGLFIFCVTAKMEAAYPLYGNDSAANYDFPGKDYGSFISKLSRRLPGFLIKDIDAWTAVIAADRLRIKAAALR